MTNSVKSSLEKIRLIESQQISEAPAAATAPAAKAAGKGIGRFIPGVGLALGAYDAYGRAKQGDWTGAALSGLSGAASLIPGIGTAASLGLAGAQAARDKARTGSYFPDEEEQAAAVAKDQQAAQAQPATAAAPTAKPVQQSAKVPPGGDPKVFALQQQLIAKGAKIAADGKMGPQTQAAMKQFPNVQLASKENKVKGNIMSEAEKIAALRNVLSQLDQPATQINERGQAVQLARDGVSALQSFGSKVANAGRNFMRGTQGQAPRTATGQFTQAGGATKAGQAVAKTGQAIANNPGKAVAATAAAAGTAGYMAGRPAAPAAPTRPPVGGNPTKPPAAAPAAAAPAQTANAGPDQKDVDELNKLAADLENSNDPADIELMKQYAGIINAINNRATGDKRTQGEIAASADMKDTY